MVSPVYFVFFALLCAVRFPLSIAQTDGACSSASQPLVRTIDPPSGTTGRDARRSTRYRITGDRLLQVATIGVILDDGRTLRAQDVTSNNSVIGFYIDDARLGRPINATLSVSPMDLDCTTTSFTITLFPTLGLVFGSRTRAQPGTVVILTSTSCVPSECGDNSTSFDIIIGDIMLERLSIQNTSLKYAGRLPNFQGPDISNAEVQIVTQYQTFRPPQFSFEFTLRQPQPITTVAPSIGQRGTNVTISLGSDPFGPGNNITVSRVRFGETDTDIISAMPLTTLNVRARSASPGRVTIRINTTDTFENASYDGPYAYMENGWNQTVDGNITDIIPAAAQLGRTIHLCGSRLLGGGTSVSTVQLGLTRFMQLQSTPLVSTSPFPGEECIQAQIPVTSQDSNETNVLLIMSNTGALVQSVDNFTISAIESVTPSRGQVDTIVTIRGRGLLSGYSSGSVNLTGVSARVLRQNNTEIVVRAGPLPSFNPTTADPMTGATQAPLQIVGVMGSIVIGVQNPFDNNVTFNVSNDTGWQYEEAGVINNISPNFGQNGTLITITGTNLLAYGSNLTHATIGGINATVVGGVTTNTMIRLIVPNSDMPAIVDVILYSNTGATVRGASSMFQYRDRGVVLSAQPNEGQRGTYVNINGTNLFGHGQNVTSVFFGDIAAIIDYSTANNTMIRVRVQQNNNLNAERVPIRIIADTQAVVNSASPIWTYLIQGQITNNQPQQGQTGSRVEITGTNLLGGGEEISQILLDGVGGTIESNSSTRIVITMDDFSSRQTNEFPNQIFIMSNTGAIVSGGTYTHRPSGTITNFSPTRGRRGTFVTISGTDLLGFGTNLINVQLAGINGTVISFNNSVIVIRAGMGPRNLSGPVQLTANTGGVVRSTANFTFDEPGVVTAVNPAQGAEGTGVSVSGSGLIPANVQLANITVGGILVTRVVTASNREVSIIVGPAPPTNADNASIVITASDGSFVDGIYFSFISFVISVRGLSRGQEGTRIEVVLPNSPQFVPSLNLRATIDNQPANILTVNTTQGFIEVEVPRSRRHGMFMADVAVEGMDGLIARLRNGFTYIPEGIICTISPSSGQPGTNVSLEGENLLGGGGMIISATLAGQQATVLRSRNDEVALQLPLTGIPPSSISYPLLGDTILIADTGAVVRRLSAFTLATPGSITQVAPSFGQNGTRVRIMGTDLLQGNLSITSVTLAGIPATVQGTPSNMLIRVIAGHSMAASQPSPVVITLSSGAVISSGTGVMYQYLIPSQFTIAPSVGTVGTRVTISGTNLLQGGATVSQVLLNGVPSMVIEASNTSINVTAQVDVSGPRQGDVVITSDTGSVLIGARLWTYNDLGFITDITPSTGQQGIVVTITGDTLQGSSSEISSCFLAGIQGQVIAFNDTMVECRVGSNPSSTMDLTGPVQLITNTGVMLNTFQSNITFTYYTAFVATVTPTQGNNGTSVTIRGTNLYSNQGGSSQLSRVLFGSIPAVVMSSSINEIRVRAALSSSASLNVTIRIESTSGSFLEHPNAWNYTTPGVILSITPNTGLPGQTVQLTGNNLVPSGVISARVILGQTEAFGVQVINTSSIEFQAGIYEGSDNPEEDLPVQIISPTGETLSSNRVVFMYNMTMGVVESISPSAGSEDSIVTISGTDLPNTSSITQVMLAGIRAAVVSAGEDTITIQAGRPPSAGASGQLSIETVDGNLLGLAGNVWRYFPAITGNNISPQTGQNGTIVTFNLSSITDLPGVTGVNLTGIPARVIRFNSTILIVQAGPSSSTTPLGNIVLELERDIVITIDNVWSYQPPVRVDTISPSSGYFNTSVIIQGNGFLANSVTITDVYLAGFETTIESQSNSRIQVRISELNSMTSNVLGPLVIIANSGATYTSVANFTYFGLRINRISPQSGTRGTLVTLEGSNLLGGGASIVSATIAGIPARVQNATSAMVGLIAGPLDSSSNLSNITYLMNTGAKVEFQNAWRYITPGEVSSVTPSSGNLGTIVSISGSNMFGGGNRAMEVRLGSQVTTDILQNFNNFIQVRAVATTGHLQPTNIQVISDTQAITESNSSAQFTYLQPGILTSVSPSTGQNGTTVILTGQRLHNSEGVARVFLAGVEARVIRIQDAGVTSTITVQAGRPRDLGAFAGPVRIHSNINTTTISTQNFTYLTEGVIFSITPDQGRNGTIISIEGENLLGGGTSLRNVVIAGIIQNTIINSSSSMVFVSVPNTNVSITGNVVLVSNTNAHVTRIDGWTHIQEGVINSISPSDGQYGTRVTIQGQNLLSGGDSLRQLQFGDVLLDILSATDTTISARIGQTTRMSAFTTNSVTLISNFESVLYQEFDWDFMNQSNITSVSPSSGFSLTEVVINGTNLFGGGTQIISVTVVGIMATRISSQDDQVVIRTGRNPDGEMRVGLLILESDTGALTEIPWIYNEECTNGTFGMAGMCQPCADGCLSCTGPTFLDCQSCEDFSILLDNSTLLCVSQCPNVSTLDNRCVDTCETNQYLQVNTSTLLDTMYCYNCSTLCDQNLGCSGPEPSQCNGCMFFEDVVNQTCVSECPSDTHYINQTKECRPCHLQCSGGCFGPSDAECLGCSNLRINANAIMGLVSLPNDVCRASCPSMFYLDSANNYCIPCDSTCSISCTGPGPFDCGECSNASFVYPNGTRKCVSSCNPNPNKMLHYQDSSNVCQPCNDFCLQSGGCRGPNASDCNRCNISLNGNCVSGCPGSTHFFRNATGSCEKCHTSCENRGCTENGPGNCLGIGPFVAGGGAVAFIIIIIFILVVVIVALVIVIVMKLRGRGGGNYNISSFNGRVIDNERYSNSRETTAQVQAIPLNVIEEEKTTNNPVFTDGGGMYNEMGHEEDTGLEALYTDAEAGHPLPEKNEPMSASQDLYTAMDSPSELPMVEGVTASQELYTDMEPILPEKDTKPVPVLPPKAESGGNKKESKAPAPLPPPEIPAKDDKPLPEKRDKSSLPENDEKPPIPAKPEKPTPPGPPAEATSGEVYTDMQGGITEVFVNAATQDDLYEDVVPPTNLATSSSPPPSSPVVDDTYEDTDDVLASVEQYRKSFGAGPSKSVTSFSPPKQPLVKKQSAPALPSQPIPKKRQSGGQLPMTPLQKSLSNSSTLSNPISPTSSNFSRPQSVISDGGIPEEESLYDDIPGGQQLLTKSQEPTRPDKSQQKKSKLWPRKK